MNKWRIAFHRSGCSCVLAIALGLCGMTAGAGSAAAQSSSASGRLEGYVVDSTGGVVVGATVTAQNTTTKESVSQQTDERGHFLFLYLSPSQYDVTVEKSGFAPYTVNAVVINVGTTPSLHPQLTPGGVETKLTVVGEAPLVDTSESALASVVERQNIDQLPLNGRNFTDFALLTPGATSDGDFGMISFNGVAGNFKWKL